MSWLLQFFGLDNASGAAYLWWSGFFADVVIFAAGFGWYWKHTCHVARCWHWARHPVEGTPYTVCRKHHPDLPAEPTTVEHVHAAAKAAKGQRERSTKIAP